TSVSIARPITTIMVTAGVLLFGTLSFFNLPLDLFPDINFPVLTVETRLSGYSSPEIENLITKPIESMVGTMNNVHRLTSRSSEGISLVKIEFNLGCNMDYMSAEVREKINLIEDEFPEDTQYSQIRKYNPSQAPIVIVSVHSAVDSARLKEIVEDRIAKPLNRIPGIANVDVKGGKTREIIVEVDHGRLKALKIPIRHIADLLEKNNLNFQMGRINRGSMSLRIRTVGEFKDLSQIEDTGLFRTDDGSIIRIKDIGRVTDTFQEEESLTRFQGESRVMLYIQKESGANILKISKQIQQELDRVGELLSKDLTIDTVYNQAVFIETSVHRLRDAALFGGILAMMVILLFLRNIQSVLVIGVGIPIYFIITFIFMYFFGITLNIISLSGFTLGIGMLLDNAIVVLENIYKKRDENFGKADAARIGTAEVSKAITISTIAHIAVFLPVIFLQEKIRMLYSGLFFTVSVSLVASLTVALTVVPFLAAKLNLSPLKIKTVSVHMVHRYRRVLIFCFRNRGKIILSGAALFLGSLVLIPLIGFDPVARLDRGEFTIVMRTAPGTRLQVTDGLARQIETVLIQTPSVKDVATEVTSDTARLRVRLIPEGERGQTTRQVVEALRPRVSTLPEAQVHFDISSRVSGGNKVELEINGFDQQTLSALASKVRQQLSDMPDITDVVIHQGNPEPEIQINILHDKAGTYGLNATRIADAVRSRITGPLATEYIDNGKEISLRVRLQEKDLKDPDLLGNILIPVLLRDGQRVMVPLSEVSTMTFTRGMAEINRKDRHRMISISAQVGRKNLIKSSAQIKEKLDGIHFPDGYNYNFGEDYQEALESRKEMLFAFALSVILVYMILASLFESFLYPLAIIVSVPLALIGSLAVLFIFGKSINIPVYVGAITLAGIAVNNAVVLVDYINLVKSNGVTKWRAIIRAGENRLRPILMTSGTTLLALLPMALNKGEGSTLWSPLALTIIGGLFSSTILTLVILPVLASFIEEIKHPGMHARPGVLKAMSTRMLWMKKS
ncbi:MAG: efflux RND transporter permease subunit, partial [Deltaproteobacteria bacterium]|nr:efflux RND transporter permease subunit [Deltaproteobacteria bacterium]